MTRRHVNLLVFAFISMTTFWWIGCATKEVSDDDIVASWGDTNVTVEAFKQKMIVRHRNEPTARKQPFEGRLSILTEYIERDMKIAEALRLGFDKREDIHKQYKDAVDRQVSDIIYNRMVRDRVFNSEMLRDFFEHNKEEVRVRHILINVPEDVKGKDTLQYWNRINEVYEKAISDENFIKLVDRYSEDDSIDRKFHGDLDFFKWGKMVDEFQEAAWNLKVGEISKPVRTRYGYHIIKMLERRSRGLEVNTSHILVKCNRRSDPAETTAAWDRAMMILKEARKPGADFAQLARRYSEDERTWVNGIIGYIPRGSMPSDYWDKALEMEVGQIDGPVRSYKGYHIIKINETRIEEPSFDDEDFKNRTLSSMSRVYRDTLQIVADAFVDSVKTAFEMKYNDKMVKLLLEKLNDPNTPTNMNRFAALTAEERDANILNDKLGGMKVEELVQIYGENAFPPEYKDDPNFIEELVKPILMPKYFAVIGREMGLESDPLVVEESRRTLDNAMLPEIEREIVFNKAAPTEEMISDYYKKNIEKFKQSATAKVNEIMVNDPKVANELFDRIKKGEDISKLARRYTQREKAKRRGGVLGPFTPDEFGAVSRKAFELEPGELAGPIDAGGMYSIIELVEKNPEHVQSLDEARKEIESDIRFQRQKEIKKAWIAEMKEKYNLKIHKDVLKGVWPLIDPLPEPLVEERKKWREDRGNIGDRAALKRKEEGEIKLKLAPGTEQTFRRGDKDIKVKIGEPRYVKKGEEVDPSKSTLKLTPKGTMEKKEVNESKTPIIKVKPKSKDK